MAQDCNCNTSHTDATTSMCNLEEHQKAPENRCETMNKHPKESQDLTTMAQVCNCNNVLRLIDATTSMGGLELPPESRNEPKTEPPVFVSFNNLDELMNIWFCETEEFERIFMYQSAEVIRRDFLLMECQKKMVELHLLTESTTASVIMCENQLQYIEHTQNLLESCSLPKLLQYLQEPWVFLSDQRCSLYGQLLSFASERKALLDLAEKFPAEYDEDSASKQQIVELLSLHQHLLSQIDLKMDAIEKAVEDVTESYNIFSQSCPCTPCLFLKHALRKDGLDITDDVAN